jgi:hypothetical protein
MFSKVLPFPRLTNSRSKSSKEKSDSNPFVSISEQQRFLVHALLVIFFLQSIIVAFNSPTAATVALALASTSVLLLRAIPLVFPVKDFGWFHPLVFTSLFWICRSFPSEAFKVYALFTYGPEVLGLSAHDSLVGTSADDLSWLSAYGALLTAVGLICYYLGFFFGPLIKLPRVYFKDALSGNFKFIAVVFFSLTVFLYFLWQRGGVEAHLLSWQAGRHQALAGDGYLIHLISLASVACLIWIAVDPLVYKRFLFWISATGSLGMKFIATGSRSQVIYWFFIGLLIWMFRQKQLRPSRVVGVLGFAVLLLGILGGFRAGVVWRGEIEWDKLTDVSSAVTSVFGAAGLEGEIVTRGGRQNGLLPILAQAGNQVDFLLGKTYLDPLTIPIPRALWAEKPRSVGALVGETFFDYVTDFAIPPGAVGEAYWNFYVPGVVGVFFLFGIFHKALFFWYKEHSSYALASMIYVVTLFIFNSPDTLSFVNWIYVVVPAIILLKIFKLAKLKV